MWLDLILNPEPLALESDALPTAYAVGFILEHKCMSNLALGIANKYYTIHMYKQSVFFYSNKYDSCSYK